MDLKPQLEEAIKCTKQAGTWVNQHQPSFARFADPIMMRTAAGLGYIEGVQGVIESTQAPPLIQAALYSAAGVGMVKWNEIVVSEINRGLHEYNSRQTVGDGFNWAKSLLLLGTASLAVSSLTDNCDSQGTPFHEENVEYITKDFVQKPANDTLRFLIGESEEELNDFESELRDLLAEEDLESDLEKFELYEPDVSLSDIVDEDSQSINLVDIEQLKSRLEETLARQAIIETPLHPKAQQHYEGYSGRHHHRMVKKIERTSQYDDLIQDAAERYNIDKEVMSALIIKESDGNFKAKSHVGARGLMQIMPRTGKYLAEIMGDKFVELTGRSTLRTSDLYDPKINIEMGAFYLRFIHDRYGDRILKKREQASKDYQEWTAADRWDFTMACYNRGPSGMTRNMMKARADTFWDLEKEQTTDEVLFYVPRIRAIAKVRAEYLMKQSGVNEEVARLVH
ncbi:transglycosylase SLT domain-containing protein [Candidatus Woesearchaeota archaeon]|jgi:soluble lytic murein transglycosylase|nr:transglycosylase SLT domain-containing protein [Candidatus Woesearchaeota archaeon]MBT4111189.1 transglycosylase SLT domain-containing protein [Candidatus Woesearchaeota archaeon]MBT4469437.1 transglycosylase SLT domain-containing protein [Candidatus Woesearchaeota archaeon]MBT6744168.1 transglycosylase SLT domain-containing protein [Candidatus Woesearchaeota archaeon]